MVINESDRQLVIRALAVQALQSPGFKQASRAIAAKFAVRLTSSPSDGEEMFDEFVRLMADLFPTMEGAMITEEAETMESPPPKTIVLLTLGLLSFAASVQMDVLGKKGSYKYEVNWSAHVFTMEWDGVLWASEAR